MIINFIVTLVVSRLTPPPVAVQEMVEDLRSPAGAELPVKILH